MMIWRQASIAGPSASRQMRVSSRTAATFGRRGEEGGDRGRRAFVDVGRPHVERHRADLEGHAGEREHQPEQQADRRRRVAREGGGDAVETGRAGEAVEQGNTVQQDARGEPAKDEIFEAGFGAALVRAAIGGQDVARQAGQLEADVERHQAGRGDHHRRADRGEQDQHRIFGGMLEIAFEPVVGGDDRDRGGRGRSAPCRTHRSRRRRSARRTARPASCGRPSVTIAAATSSATDDPGRDPGGAAATEGGNHHQHDRADGQDDFGKDGGDVHQWASAGVSGFSGAMRFGLGSRLSGGRLRCRSSARRARSGSAAVPTSSRIGAMKLSG